MAHFVDTNLVIYAILGGDKAPAALAALSDATISVQVLNELSNVAIRKLGCNQAELAELIAEIRAQVSSIQPVTEATHDLARHIAFRHKLSFYDSALLAAGLLADCDAFFSEDLQHGLVIENQLTVINPFV